MIVEHKLSDIINSNEYQSEKIDNGSYGVIEKLTNRLTNKVYAIKTISFEKFTKINDVIGHNRLYYMVMYEIEIMKKLNQLDCAMFPTFYDSIIFRKNDRMVDRIIILMKYIPGKSLKQFTSDLFDFDSEEIRKIIITVSVSILKLIKILHQNGIIHKDLKLENIMINYDTSTSIYLIDFGLACINPKLGIPKHSTLTSRPDYWNEMQGTPFYISPKLIELNTITYSKTQNINSFDQSKIYDIWSFGVILYYLIYRCFPFSGKTVNELFNQIKQHKQLTLEDIKPYSDIIEIIRKILKNFDEELNVESIIEDFTQIIQTTEQNK